MYKENQLYSELMRYLLILMLLVGCSGNKAPEKPREICALGKKDRCASPTVCEPGTNTCKVIEVCSICEDEERNMHDWVCKADETGKLNWYCEPSESFY